MYALALEFGQWDAAGWGASVTHAQVVDWLAYRTERARRLTELAKRKQTILPYR